MIDAYFQRQLELLNEHLDVNSSDVRFDKRTEFVAFIRGKVYFQDGSRLHFRELADVELVVQRAAYSYHYQNANGDIIFRSDNTPIFRVCLMPLITNMSPVKRMWLRQIHPI